ncbi:hypothetical protein [Leptospira alexanderi]|uniref:hypothetical protein n=1 Tax=Leptospira alexanderi TaxID=100053 RepID=UPI0009914B19|nr:hypothetical protein [Leptospira alexanderi]
MYTRIHKRQSPKAIFRHTHSDHIRKETRYYLCVESELSLTKERLGKKSNVETLRYGQAIYRNGVKISFHSADPILGFAQIRIEYKGKIQ